MIRLAENGFFREGETVVCTLTGHGLKDHDYALGSADLEPTPPEAEAVLETSGITQTAACASR